MLSLQGFAQASISNPCARVLTGAGQDSLLWDAVVCTGFQGFVIFASPDTSSPLQIIDTITDPNALGYAISNSTETSRNYQIGMICGGSITVSSSVFNNLRPVTPDLRAVSLFSGSPVLTWYPSPSPDVIGYQVYKENPYGSGNFFPYPSNNSLINGLSFTDVNSTELLVRYALVAVSPCNKGLLGEGNAIDGTTGPHSSIFLDYSIDNCTQEISLNWNPYENWRDGVNSYEIWLSKNSGNPQLLGNTNSTGYIYTGAQNGDALEFWIKAKEQNSSNEALSNKVSFTASLNNAMDFLQLTAATVDATSTGIEVAWRWDIDSDFDQAWLERSTDLQDWQAINNYNSLSSIDNNYLDNNTDPAQNRYYYRVRALDACGQELISNYAGTLLLAGEAQASFNNLLEWTPLDAEYGSVIYYDLYKVVNGMDNRIARLDDSTINYLDHVDVNLEAEANSCYYVLAEGRISLPDGSQRFLFSRSNLLCLEQLSALWFPNAFAPEGVNSIFRPRVAYSSTLQSYSLEIYDRYGAVVFSSSNTEMGWDGLINGRAAAQGVYVYLAKYQLANGATNSLRGQLMLIR